MHKVIKPDENNFKLVTKLILILKMQHLVMGYSVVWLLFINILLNLVKLCVFA